MCLKVDKTRGHNLNSLYEFEKLLPWRRRCVTDFGLYNRIKHKTKREPEASHYEIDVGAAVSTWECVFRVLA